MRYLKSIITVSLATTLLPALSAGEPVWTANERRAQYGELTTPVRLKPRPRIPVPTSSPIDLYEYGKTLKRYSSTHAFAMQTLFREGQPTLRLRQQYPPIGFYPVVTGNADSPNEGPSATVMVSVAESWWTKGWNWSDCTVSATAPLTNFEIRWIPKIRYIHRADCSNGKVNTSGNALTHTEAGGELSVRPAAQASSVGTTFQTPVTINKSEGQSVSVNAGVSFPWGVSAGVSWNIGGDDWDQTQPWVATSIYRASMVNTGNVRRVECRVAFRVVATGHIHNYAIRSYSEVEAEHETFDFNKQ